MLFKQKVSVTEPALSYEIEYEILKILKLI